VGLCVHVYVCACLCVRTHMRVRNVCSALVWGVGVAVHHLWCWCASRTMVALLVEMRVVVCERMCSCESMCSCELGRAMWVLLLMGPCTACRIRGLGPACTAPATSPAMPTQSHANPVPCKASPTPTQSHANPIPRQPSPMQSHPMQSQSHDNPPPPQPSPMQSQSHANPVPCKASPLTFLSRKHTKNTGAGAQPCTPC